MALPALEAKYLDSSVAPIYTENTEIEVLIDGKNYFTAIHKAISSTTSGDSIFIVGWQFDPALKLDTGEVLPASNESIGRLLALKQAAGVDVRLVLNGSANLYWAPLLPWSRTLQAAETLRSLLPLGQTTPPLSQRVLFDWSGANWTGSHHQKATIIKSGSGLWIAFLGGMDMVENHWDAGIAEPEPWPGQTQTQVRRNPHTKKKFIDGSDWGWHDVGVQLRGEAAKGVWENFRHRWEEAITLPPRHWLLPVQPGNEAEVLKPFNPTPLPATPAASPPQVSGAVHSRSVQILRSRFKFKIPNRIGPGGIPWTGISGEPSTPGAFFEVFSVLKKAISAAQRYIYIEDQFLGDSLHLEEIPPPGFSLFPHLLNALKGSSTLRVIFVGSGRKDPGDPGPALKNQHFTSSVEELIDSLPSNKKTNVAVWRLEQGTVHSKLMLIDDEFASIGSANFQDRSMFGIDSELHAAIVADDDLVKDLRIALWAEHWLLDRTDPAIKSGLQDLNIALGLWRGVWYDTSYWPTLTGYGPPGPFGALQPVLTAAPLPLPF